MKRILKYTLLAIVAFTLLTWFGGRWVLSFSAADYEGEFDVSGIAAPVEISFDAMGIPQVWADTDADMFYALGWLHASERLFQMELVRRVAGGELSEIFGAPAFEFDRRQRQIGFARLARQNREISNAEVRTLMQKYCDGINAWVDQKTILPPEFVILNFSPRKWQVEDCLITSIYQTWYSHELMDNDPEYRQLSDALGDTVVQILKAYKPWSPPTVHNSFLERLFGKDAFPMRMSSASNSWVVSPDKTTTGAAIHCSDPHLAVNQAPGFWYTVGLHSKKDGSNVLGVTAPGIPTVAMGHNGVTAFSFTVASVDVIDYYRFERHPEEPNRIKTADGYQALQVVQENISVKDEEAPREVSILLSPRGPVIEEDSLSVIALKWAGFDMDINRLLEAGLGLHNVQNFADFRRCVTGFGALDVNWVYSDIQGNIGYQLGTMIPKRDYHDTYKLLSGADTETDWRGYYELAQTPYAFNPTEGWLASCNNQIVSDQWPYDLPGFYDPYRIVRASELLTEKGKFSPAQLENMQFDLISIRAQRWKSLMADGAAVLNKTALVQEFNDWSGEMSVDNQTAALFMLWWQALAKPLFQDNLSDDWAAGRQIQEEIMSAGYRSVIDDLHTADAAEQLSDISAAALKAVLDTHGRAAYGDISFLKIAHPLSQVEILDTWLSLNRGPLPIGGDAGTLNANWNYWSETDRRFYASVGPSMRFILDWSDVDGFRIITNLGQSGNPFSPHYDDFLNVMQSGEQWNVPFSREKVFAKRKSMVTLMPQGGTQ